MLKEKVVSEELKGVLIVTSLSSENAEANVKFIKTDYAKRIVIVQFFFCLTIFAFK